MNRFRSIAVTAVAGFVLVACGPAASGSSDEPSSQASEAAASEAQASGDGVLPSFTEGAVADLEALIPDTVGTLTLHKESMPGSEYLLSQDDPALTKFIEDLGVSPSDISIAVGTGFSTDGSSSLVIIAFRAAGANTDRLVSGFKEASSAQSETPVTWTNSELGGKQVEMSTTGGSTTYLYANGDVLFFVTGDAASTEEAISGLP